MCENLTVLDLRISTKQLRIINESLATHVLNEGAPGSDLQEARNMVEMITDIQELHASGNALASGTLHDLYEGGVFGEQDFGDPFNVAKAAATAYINKHLVEYFKQAQEAEDAPETLDAKERAADFAMWLNDNVDSFK